MLEATHCLVKMKGVTVANCVALWKMKTGFFIEQKAVYDLRLALAVH